MNDLDQEIDIDSSTDFDNFKIDRSFRRRIFNNQIFRAFGKIKKFLFFRS